MVVLLEVFTSKNCPFCPKAIAAVEEVVKELGSQVEYKHYDVDEYVDKTMEYKIMSVPTIVVNGRVAFRDAPEPKRLISKIKRNMK